MATSVLSMILETKKRGNAGAEVTAELQGVTRGLGQFLGLSANVLTFTGILYGLRSAARATIGEFQAYAGEVRDLSGVTGEGAEQTSRLLQVMDDFEIQGEQLSAAMRALRTQGLSPTVDVIAELSDQYLALAPGIERINFLQENFGRGGIAFQNIMAQGSQAIRDRAAAVSESLILDEEQIRQSEELRLATDDLQDAWAGVRMEIAEGLVPTLAAALTSLGALLSRNQRLTAALDEHNTQVAQTAATYEDYITEQRRSAQVAGYQIDAQGRLIQTIHGGGGTYARIIEDTFLLTAAEWEQIHALEEQETRMEGYTETTRRAADATREVASAAETAAANAAAMRAGFEAADTGLAGMIENFRTTAAWIAGGGLQLQTAAESVITAFQRGAISQEDADQLLQPIEAAALGLQEDIGQIEMSDAIRTMAADWGLSWGDARAAIQGARTDILTLPEEVRTQIRVAVQWQITGGLSRKGEQYGGSWIVEGPSGIDRVPVGFMATAGERVIVQTQEQQRRGGGSVSVGTVNISSGMDAATFLGMLRRIVT
jgi:hypothetical protein